MFDLSWTEIFLVAVIGVLVIGPKDIPQILYTLGRMVRRLQYVRFAMTQQFEDFMRVHDLEDLRHGVNFEAPKSKAPSEQIDYDESAADADYFTQDPTSEKADHDRVPE